MWSGKARFVLCQSRIYVRLDTRLDNTPHLVKRNTINLLIFTEKKIEITIVPINDILIF